MAVFCEAFSVVAQKRVLDERFVGGCAQYLLEAPSPLTVCDDGILIRVGFMSPQDVRTWVEYIQAKGLTFTRTIGATVEACDFVVVDQLEGPTCRCDWIETELVGGNRWVWMAGRERGNLVLPPGRAIGDSRIRKLSEGEVSALPVFSQRGVMQILDTSDGSVWYSGRAYLENDAHEDLLRRAVIELQLGRPLSARLLILEAELIKPLEHQDRELAGLVATQCLRGGFVSGRQRETLISEGLRRWTLMSDNEPTASRSMVWVQRGCFEVLSGDMESAGRSALHAMRLDPTSETARSLAQACGVPICHVCGESMNELRRFGGMIPDLTREKIMCPACTAHWQKQRNVRVVGAVAEGLTGRVIWPLLMINWLIRSMLGLTRGSWQALRRVIQSRRR